MVSRACRFSWWFTGPSPFSLPSETPVADAPNAEAPTVADVATKVNEEVAAAVEDGKQLAAKDSSKQQQPGFARLFRARTGMSGGR